MNNNEIRTPVPSSSAYRVIKKCNCGGTFIYQYTVNQSSSHDRAYVHRCDKCNTEKGLNNKYPYIEY